MSKENIYIFTDDDLLKNQYKMIIENLLCIMNSLDKDEIDFRILEIENTLKYFQKLRIKIIERTDINENV